MTTLFFCLAVIASANHDRPVFQSVQIEPGLELVEITSANAEQAGQIDVTIRNGGPGPLTAWAIALTVRKQADSEPRTSLHSTDLLPSLISVESGWAAPTARLRVIEPGSSTTVSIPVAEPAIDMTITLVAAVFADGTILGPAERLQSVRRGRERMATNVDAWLPILAEARHRTSTAERIAYLRQEREKRLSTLRTPNAEGSLPSLVGQLISHAERRPDSLGPELESLMRYLTSLRIEARRAFKR